MALNFIPGVGQVVAPVTTGIAVVRGTIGEQAYQAARTSTTWAGSAFMGFVPINPIMWLIQIPLFIVIILVLIYTFGVGAGKAALSAYISQAIITMFIAQFILDKFLKYGLGV